MNVSVFGNIGRPVTSFSMTLPKSKPVRNSVLGSSMASHSPTTSFASSVKGPLLPQKESSLGSRPKTRSSLGVKTWRANLFPSSSPASKREVELLGEWLNSVLAENLETNESPLDVCANAQHWFSVAFNELLRQVSVSCAERGRLFAVIWKRNQDLLSKLVQIQKNERQYILQCHKERVQFLKTDLDFCNSRYETVQAAYNEELNRWQESQQRDVSKFANLQQKIDEQSASRKELLEELKILQKKLGIKTQEDLEKEHTPAPTFRLPEMRWKIQEIRRRLLSNYLPTNDEIFNLTEDFEHFLRYQKLNPSIHGIRQTYEEYFLSLPSEEKGTIKSLEWLSALISYIVSNYMVAVEPMGLKKITDTPFIQFIYNTLIGFYGIREFAEQTLLDFLTTLTSARNESSRAMIFSRFIGLNDPFPPEALPFYVYCLSIMNKEHPGPLFPEMEGNDPTLSGVPTQALLSASEKILQKFTEGRTMKFYMERIDKIAADGALRFGGKNLGELDSVLSYLTEGYLDECTKFENLTQEPFDAIQGECQTFSQFKTLFQPSRKNIPTYVMPHLMAQILHDGPITRESFGQAVKSYGYFQPFQLKPEDYISNQNPEDVVKFVKLEVEYWEPKYQAALKKTQETNDEIATKQLRAAKAKLEQVLVGRTMGKTANNLIREFFERVYLINIQQQII